MKSAYQLLSNEQPNLILIKYFPTDFRKKCFHLMRLLPPQLRGLLQDAARCSYVSLWIVKNNISLFHSCKERFIQNAIGIV